MGYGRERRSHWEVCRGTQHPQGRAGFLRQDGSVQRKDWERGGSTAGVLEFLRASEGLKAGVEEESDGELGRGCPEPLGTGVQETREALGVPWRRDAV